MCGEGWPCTDSAASKAAPEVQATRGIGLPTLSSAAARKAARGPFAIVVGFLLYGSGVYRLFPRALVIPHLPVPVVAVGGVVLAQAVQ